MSQFDVTIRTALPDDAAVIAQIYVNAWNEGFGSLMPPIQADPARIEQWHLDLSNATPPVGGLPNARGEL